MKIQYPHDKLKNPLPMVGENAIPTLQTKTYYLWFMRMQYPHKKLKNPLPMVVGNAILA
jgi:hypothetical protein